MIIYSVSETKSERLGFILEKRDKKNKYVYKMTRYTNVIVNISEGQKEKLQHAIKAGCSAVSMRLGHKDLQGNDILAVTTSQAKTLAKAHENGKGITIRMSLNQLKYNMKTAGGFLGLLAGLAARALPMLAKTVLPALGVGAPSGLASSGVQKSNGVRSLSQERKMHFPSGNGWAWIKTVQRSRITVLRKWIVFKTRGTTLRWKRTFARP